jgi:CubicO group peptidase (beta-lactamase class C family)
MMNDQKKRATIIFMLILFGGILLGCSTIKSEQSSIIDSEIEKKIEEIVVGGELPSVQVAVINQNQIVWSKTFGENSDTYYLYMNGSVQKVVDATAILQLYEKGMIDLDADISEYIPFEISHPKYPNVPITTRMLLSHRSGLDAVSDQFGWDTKCQFIEYRPNCNLSTSKMSLEEYLIP